LRSSLFWASLVGGSFAGSGAPGFSAVASLSLKDFPKLRETLLSSYWPRVVLDEKCSIPWYGPSMRVYRGSTCTGILIDTSHPEMTTDWNIAYSWPRPVGGLPTGEKFRIKLYVVVPHPWGSSLRSCANQSQGGDLWLLLPLG
jgi:hypothetical protein